MNLSSIAVFFTFALSQTSPLLKCDPTPNLGIKVDTISRAGAIEVEMVNLSDKPIRVWKDSNSWGYAHWRVIIVRQGLLITLFQNPNQAFTKNGPDYDQIAPKGHLAKKLDLNDGEWCGAENKGEVEFKSGDRIIVSYDVPKSFARPELADSVAANSMGVWYGVVATTTTAP